MKNYFENESVIIPFEKVIVVAKINKLLEEKWVNGNA